MVFAKIIALAAHILFAMPILTGQGRILKNFFSNYFFYYTSRTMHLSYMIFPIFAKSYQASLKTEFIEHPNFIYYQGFYIIVCSWLGAAFLFVFVQSPIDDLFRFSVFKILSKTIASLDFGVKPMNFETSLLFLISV